MHAPLQETDMGKKGRWLQNIGQIATTGPNIACCEEHNFVSRRI